MSYKKEISSSDIEIVRTTSEDHRKEIIRKNNNSETYTSYISKFYMSVIKRLKR